MPGANVPAGQPAREAGSEPTQLVPDSGSASLQDRGKRAVRTTAALTGESRPGPRVPASLPDGALLRLVSHALGHMPSRVLSQCRGEASGGGRVRVACKAPDTHTQPFGLPHCVARALLNPQQGLLSRSPRFRARESQVTAQLCHGLIPHPTVTGFLSTSDEFLGF